MKTTSYQKETEPFSYRHEFHAGNIGDVWKHLIWIELLTALQAQHESLTVVDCHAGLGEYRLKPTGEWSEGLGRILSLDEKSAPPALQHYLRQVKPGGEAAGRRYPGSPQLCAVHLRPGDKLICCELVEDVCAGLRQSMDGFPSVEVIQGDGPEIMRERCAGHGANRELFLLDPPWTAKREWLDLPRLIGESSSLWPEAVFALWYPIKSYGRVNEMQRLLRGAQLPALVMELITTPLQHRRNRLNGSGVVVINPPGRVAVEAAAAGAVLAQECAVLPHQWELRVFSF